MWAAACDRNGSHRTISRSSSCPCAIIGRDRSDTFNWIAGTIGSSWRTGPIIMSATFRKLNLKDQTEILVLKATDAFEPEREGLRGVRVVRRLDAVKGVAFALAFVTRRVELRQLSVALAARAIGDALLWFAYPKGTSKKYTCDFNRDDGWGALRESGFDSVRQIAIDEDWSALRFRRNEFIERPGQ
jgi:hypothetical protein